MVKDLCSFKGNYPSNTIYAETPNFQVLSLKHMDPDPISSHQHAVVNTSYSQYSSTSRHLPDSVQLKLNKQRLIKQFCWYKHYLVGARVRRGEIKALKIAFTFLFIPLISCITPGTIIIKIATSLQKVRKIWMRALQLTLMLFRTITSARGEKKEWLKESLHPSKSIINSGQKELSPSIDSKHL